MAVLRSVLQDYQSFARRANAKCRMRLRPWPAASTKLDNHTRAGTNSLLTLLVQTIAPRPRAVWLGRCRPRGRVPRVAIPACDVRKKNAPWFGKAGENSTIWACPSPKFIMGGSDEEKYDHPTQKPVELMRRPILNHLKRGELVYEPILGSGTTLTARNHMSRRIRWPCNDLPHNGRVSHAQARKAAHAELLGLCALFASI